MSKYAPLAAHLRGRASPVRMTLEQIEELLGPLPASARRWRAWWENSRSHVQAVAWMEAGWLVTEADLVRGVVVFAHG